MRRAQTKKKNDVALLTAAISKIPSLPPRKKKPTNPRGGNPPKKYQFQKGFSGNPGGRRRDYALQLSARMMHSSPPRELCEQLGINPRVSWGEAIMISLCKAAVGGDVSAAREVLAALGISGTAARNNVLVNVETSDPAQMRRYERFIFETRWVPEDQFEKVWEMCRSLAQPPSVELTDKCLPPSEEETALLEENNDAAR